MQKVRKQGGGRGLSSRVTAAVTVKPWTGPNKASLTLQLNDRVRRHSSSSMEEHPCLGLSRAQETLEPRPNKGTALTDGWIALCSTGQSDPYSTPRVLDCHSTGRRLKFCFAVKQHTRTQESHNANLERNISTWHCYSAMFSEVPWRVTSSPLLHCHH